MLEAVDRRVVARLLSALDEVRTLIASPQTRAPIDSKAERERSGSRRAREPAGSYPAPLGGCAPAAPANLAPNPIVD